MLEIPQHDGLTIAEISNWSPSFLLNVALIKGFVPRKHSWDVMASMYIGRTTHEFLINLSAVSH